MAPAAVCSRIGCVSTTTPPEGRAGSPAARWRTIAVRPQYVGPGAAGSSCHRPNSLPSGISTFTGCPAMSPHPGRRSDRPRSCPHSLMRRRRHLVRSRSCSSRSSASRDRTSALSASITMLLATSTSPPAAAASLSRSTRRASAPDARYRTPGAGSRGEFPLAAALDRRHRP